MSLLISVTRKPSHTKPNREERKRKKIILIKKNEKGEKSEKKKNKSGPSLIFDFENPRSDIWKRGIVPVYHSLDENPPGGTRPRRGVSSFFSAASAL